VPGRLDADTDGGAVFQTVPLSLAGKWGPANCFTAGGFSLFSTTFQFQ